MKKILSILFAFVLLLGVGTGACRTMAQAETEREFDLVNVLDDLTSSTDAAGHAFDLTDYPYNEQGRVQLVTLAEYCYSYAANMRENYGIYLYIYNPTGKEFDSGAPLNKAKFAVSYREDGKTNGSEKFDLKFCNKSTGDYNNLFYKFRVIDHKSADGKTIEERVNSNGRRYDLSEIEILTKGETNATAYGVGGTYKYTGYAKGYGPDEAAESTLSCEVTELETIETTVHSTVYRPEGSFYQGEQDQLNSVFFSVPEYFFEEYGKITSITAEWYEYKTNPIFITESIEHAEIFNELVGKDITKTDFTGSIGAWKDQEQSGNFIRDIYEWVYNANMGVIGNLGEDIPRDRLTAVFNTMGVDFEKYSVSDGQLKRALQAYTASLGGELINGKYSEALFSDEVDAGHIRGYRNPTIDSDAMFSLTSYKLTQDFWQQIFGGSSIESTTYKDIQAIVTLDEEDMKGEASEISKRLYIGESEVKDLQTEFTAAKSSGKRVVLFRYAVSKYHAYPAVYNLNNDKPSSGGYKVYRDGYVAEQTVYLDFDIIETTFYREGVYTVIPVVSSPIDIIGTVSPPLSNDPVGAGGCMDSSTGWSLLTLLLIVIAVILTVWIMTSIIKSFGGNQKVLIQYPESPKASKSPPKENKSPPADKTVKRAELAAGRAEKAAKQAKSSAESARNGCKKTGGTNNSAARSAAKSKPTASKRQSTAAKPKQTAVKKPAAKTTERRKR